MIPRQLINCRFLRVRFGEKRPFENEWPSKPYTYSQIQQYFPKENYGIQAGPDIRMLDDDTPLKGLHKLYNENFPPTFQVRGHLYFKFDNAHADKIIFESKVLLFPNSKGVLSPHLGELQGEGTMCVGPGSTHPDGSKYEVIQDLPVQTISFEKFMKVFGEYIKEDKPKIIRDHKPSKWTGDNITDIPIGNIISFDGLRDVGRGCLQGTHPKHGSDNGMNFRVDVKNNTWTCFRCNDKNSRGCGGPSELIAVMEGILQCDEVGAQCFTVEKAQEVIAVAREKYGLKVPKQDLGEVRGWAKNISIKELAKKYSFEKCPTCENSWELQTTHGMFYCKTCKYGGGLNKFAMLILSQSNNEKT